MALIPPTLTGTFSIPTKTITDAPFFLSPYTPSSNSTGTWIYESSDANIADISDDRCYINGIGSCIITATQSETEIYSSISVTAVLTVTRVTTVLGTFTVPTKTYGDAPFMLTPPTTNSDGAWGYVSDDISVADIIDDIVTINGVGHCTITAIQTETDYYTGASTTASFTVLSNTTPTPSDIFNNPDLTGAEKASAGKALGYSAINMLLLGLTPADMYPSYSLEELRKANVSVVDLASIEGVTLTDLANGGFTAQQIINELPAITPSDLFGAGFPLFDIKSAVTPSPSVADILALSPSINSGDLKNAGFTPAELFAGLTLEQFLGAGFSIQQYKDAGVTYEQMLAYGYSAFDLADYYVL